MDLVIFNKQTDLALTETIAQDVDKFNEASGGAIKLDVKPAKGDFDIKSSFAAIDGLVRRRNAYGQGNIVSTRLNQIKNASVKIGAGTKTVVWENQQYLWAQRHPEEAALTVAKQLSKGMLGDMLNTSILSAVAALKNQSESLFVGTADFNGLVNTSSLFGDRASSIRAWVMHSGFLNKLQIQAVDNKQRLFSYDGVNVMEDGFGRIFIVTDSPALLEKSQNENIYYAVGLVEGAIEVSKNEDFNSALVPAVGQENIAYNYQAEWSYNLGIKGYTWYMENGGKSPNNTALGTGINWVRSASSVKDTAGVVLQAKP